jgi:sterol desaturase/sphingolipid hydroxylase (fatty acid hydroxylase superfamily)
MERLEGLYLDASGWFFEHAIQPLLYGLGLMAWAEDLYAWMDFAALGLLTMAVTAAVCAPLEHWFPVERWENSRAVWTDAFYTVLTRLGILPLLAFVIGAVVQGRLAGFFADLGIIPPTLETLFPGLRAWPLVALALYVVILDFGEYWRHRLQHNLPWWWALHSLHHAQTQMTFWTDDRNHILDEIIAACWFGGLALLIGVPPGQFPLIVLLLRLVESLSHANVRLSFGPVGERMVVSPRFHRLHHGVLSIGQEGRNFAVLLPVWDWIFRTADFRRDHYPVTGDPTAPEALVSGGWSRQQWEGAKRLWRAVAG